MAESKIHIQEGVKMSDIFGIGVGVKSSVSLFFICARGSGRTSLLSEYIKQGDIVVFATTNEADHVKRIAKKKNIDIKTIVVNPAYCFQLSEKMAGLSGRLVFDHRWIELFYQVQIDKIGESISEMVSNFSRIPHG